MSPDLRDENVFTLLDGYSVIKHVKLMRQNESSLLAQISLDPHKISLNTRVENTNK
jgi:hypothetical protein